MRGHRPFFSFLVSSLFPLLDVYLPLSAPEAPSIFSRHGRGHGERRAGTGDRRQATRDSGHGTRGRAGGTANKSLETRQGTYDRAQRTGDRDM